MRVRGNVMRAYASGETARDKSWERLSPFYGNELMDEYFYAGYDGKKLGDKLEILDRSAANYAKTGLETRSLRPVTLSEVST